MLIHIKRNAEVFGPYSIEEAREYLSRARLLLSDFAQLPGTTEWIPLASVPGVRSAPPPPPATTLPPPTIAQPAGPQQQAVPLPTVTQPVVPREQAQHSELRLRAVLNDAAGILFLSLLLGAIVWIFAEPARRMSAIEVTEALVIAVCLTISACSATGNRWRHVACVALFGWAWSIINVLFFGFSVEWWILSALGWGFLTAVGGGLSYLFKHKHSRPATGSSVLSVVVAVLLLVVVILVACSIYVFTSAPAAGRPTPQDTAALASPSAVASLPETQIQIPGAPAAGDATEADTQAQAAAQFEKDFYEKYPDLKPYSSVCDAVAAKLYQSGSNDFLKLTRDERMQAFAKGAREEIKRQQQPALPPGAMVLKGEWGNAPRMTAPTTPEWVKAAERKPDTSIHFTGREPGHAFGPPIPDTSLAGGGTGDMPDWVRHSPGHVQSAWQQIQEVNAFNKNAAERDRALTEREQALREQQVEDAQEAARARAQSLPAVPPQPAWQVRPENPPPAVPQVKSGTGFFITDDGYFLTCCHVIKGASHISIRSGQARYLAKLVRADSQNDLALLKVSGTFRSLPVAPPRSVKLGDSVFTIGFPNVDLQGFEPKLTKGDVSSLAGGRDNPLYFQISVPVQPGNSGGALVNTVGNVVGIVSDRLSDSAALETTGMLAQNVNYAVKCDSVTAFLGALPEVLGKLKSPYRPKDRKSEDVVKEAQDATALVIASHLSPGGSSLAAMGNGHAAGALPVELRINGIAGGPGHRLVIINNNTFAAGEEGDVISNGDRVRIRCLQIKDNAAVVQIGKERQTLNLP